MRTSRLISLVAVAGMLTALTACASDSGSSATGDVVTADSAPVADGTFPVTIEHKLGTVTIDKKPERIATVGWANQEVPLALGVVPVGMSKAAWGDDDKDGVLPWVEEKLTELGAETPVLFDETNGPDFEAVADTKPDVILSSYSGLTKEEYATLSKIAPVIAYPEVAWGTSMYEMIRLNSAAIGLATSGDKLVSDLEAEIKTALDAHPRMADTTYLFASIDPTDLSQVGYYTALDTRPGFLADLGITLPQLVKDSADSTDFYLMTSSEQTEKFEDVDVIVAYGDNTTLPMLQADPLLSKIPAIAEGRFVTLMNDTPIASSANPSPLSIGWGINEYFDLLEAPLLGP